jgi:hypothetical protein
MNKDSLVQTMPPIKDLVETTLKPRHWLLYYKNTWTRNLVARSIDVATDTVLKKANPDDMVLNEDGSETVPVKQRLETRKMLVQDALDLLAGIEILLAIPEDEFEKTVWSKEALAVAEDMLPKKEEVKTGNAPETSTPGATPTPPASEAKT